MIVRVLTQIIFQMFNQTFLIVVVGFVNVFVGQIVVRDVHITIAFFRNIIFLLWRSVAFFVGGIVRTARFSSAIAFITRRLRPWPVPR